LRPRWGGDYSSSTHFIFFQSLTISECSSISTYVCCIMTRCSHLVSSLIVRGNNKNFITSLFSPIFGGSLFLHTIFFLLLNYLVICIFLQRLYQQNILMSMAELLYCIYFYILFVKFEPLSTKFIFYVIIR